MAAPLSTTYSPEAKREIVDHVFAQLSAGRSITKVFQEDEGLCNEDTFWTWIGADPVLSEELARARERNIERHLTEVIEIVDAPTGEARLGYDKHGNPYAYMDGDSVRRAGMRAEYRLRVAAMLMPRKYGAKVDVTSGGEALKPTQLTDNRVQSLVQLAIERAAAARERVAKEDKE
jgi:hypothetical protein